jgi:hypothetical protein
MTTLRSPQIQEQYDFQEDGVEEQVPSITSTVEPVAGDKRPREDESHEESHSESRPPPQAPRAAQNGPSSTAVPSASIDVKMNGNYSGTGTPLPGVQQNIDAQGMAIAGQDALYIGDLQWVRLSSRLVSCSYRSEMPCFCIVFFCFFCSGQLMKICDKLLCPSALRLITTTSHFLNIK